MIHDIHTAALILMVLLLITPVIVMAVTKSVVMVIAAVVALAIVGAAWILTRNPVAALCCLLLLTIVQWAVVPSAKLPHFRGQTLRLRLRLRLHPSRGFATAFEVFCHWGRYASFRASKRTRPGLPLWQRVCHPVSHGIFLGRVQYRLGLRLPVQEHIVMFGPPRAYKSGFFSRAIGSFRGAAVSTSTKGDMVALTAGVRQHRGSPIFVFDPMRLSPYRSTIRWNLVAGCAIPSVAIRRAQALCEAASTEGTEEATFWANQAAMQMRALLCAADLMHRDFRTVNHWILSGATQAAEKKLMEAGYITWASVLRQMRSGKAERTTATIRLVLSDAVSFMSDPALAECVVPGPGEQFDIERFLMESGSLYLIGEQRGKAAPMAPLFSCMVTEIHFMASQIAGQMKGQRLDPPLLLALDEVTQIVPIPLPSIVADSGGRGIQLLIAAHGIAQLKSRWDEDGAQTILDCCNKMFNPGIQDIHTLELACELAGKEWFKVHGDDKRQELPKIDVDSIRQLPPKRTLMIRTWRAPVIVRLAMGWRSVWYLLARLRNYSQPVLGTLPALRLPTGDGSIEFLVEEAHAMADRDVADAMQDLTDMEPVVPADGSGADFPEDGDDREPEPIPPGLPGVPQPRFAPPAGPNGHGPNGHGPNGPNGHGQNGTGVVNGNGNGRANGHSNGSGQAFQGPANGHRPHQNGNGAQPPQAGRHTDPWGGEL